MISPNELNANLSIAADYMIEILDMKIELLDRTLIKPKFCNPRYKHLTNTQLEIAIIKILKLTDKYLNAD